jgi:putative addiction module component (TIGR02574 family)
MKPVELPLSQLTLPQKLDLMESIWADLSGDPQSFESPDWHREVLQDREAALDSGKASLSDWDEAKERIRKRIR